MINHRYLIAAGILAISASLATAPAQAAGVVAGTVITNTATATYRSGTANQSAASNPVTVTVDQLLDVAVAGLDTSAVSVNSNAVILSYSVTNSGNGNDRFNLRADPVVSGNVTILEVSYDSNNNGVYDSGDTVIANGAASSLIAPDAALKVFVKVALPAGATDEQASDVRLTATSVIGTGAPGTVMAGAGVGGVDAVVGSSNATSNATNSIIASLASVSLEKSAAIVDLFGGSSPLPGATVTYTIVTKVTGTGTAEGVHVVDVIPTGTTYVTGSLKLDGSALTDAADTDAGTAGSTGIDVALGDLVETTSTTQKTVSFMVKVN